MAIDRAEAFVTLTAQAAGTWAYKTAQALEEAHGWQQQQSVQTTGGDEFYIELVGVLPLGARALRARVYVWKVEVRE